VLLCGILLINYLTTGLFSDLALRYLWKFTDVEAVYRWGALPKVILLPRDFNSIPIVPLKSSINFLNFVLRFYLLWPLFFGGLLVASISIWVRHRTAGFARQHLHEALVLIAAFLVFVFLTLTQGRVLSVSFYRFSSFMVPVVIVTSIAMWAVPIRHQAASYVTAISKHPVAPLIVLALCAVVTSIKTPIDRDIVPLGTAAVKYGAGMLSTDDAYVHQANGRPVGPWGGIYPGSRGAYMVVGPRTRIWSMHRQTRCMLPDCRMMYYGAFIMSRSWDRIMWGTLEEGQTALRNAGINYFLFSNELEIGDPLPLSPLFSPDNIGRYFGIRWTDGTTTLLTWVGPDTTPLSDAWLTEYRKAVENSPDVQRFPNSVMKAIFDRLYATPHPWRSSDLLRQDSQFRDPGDGR
jgi:hypothetical protein